jgi:hypothetical protein
MSETRVFQKPYPKKSFTRAEVQDLATPLTRQAVTRPWRRTRQIGC